MEDIFYQIKTKLPMREVAESYGLHLTRQGMVCCHFHEDKTPSLKVYDDHFYCFGCGAAGDATGFVARLYNLSQLEAAQKICRDFGLSIDSQAVISPAKSVLDERREFLEWEKKAFITVSGYLKPLKIWRITYAPKTQTDELHPLFSESLNMKEYTEYLCNIFTVGTEPKKRTLYICNRADVDTMEQRLQKVMADEKRSIKRKVI